MTNPKYIIIKLRNYIYNIIKNKNYKHLNPNDIIDNTSIRSREIASEWKSIVENVHTRDVLIEKLNSDYENDFGEKINIWRGGKIIKNGTILYRGFSRKNNESPLERLKKELETPRFFFIGNIEEAYRYARWLPIEKYWPCVVKCQVTRDLYVASIHINRVLDGTNSLIDSRLFGPCKDSRYATEMCNWFSREKKYHKESIFQGILHDEDGAMIITSMKDIKIIGFATMNRYDKNLNDKFLPDIFRIK